MLAKRDQADARQRECARVGVESLATAGTARQKPDERCDCACGDPTADFARASAEVLDAYAGDGVVERTGPAWGLAYSNQLLHGRDLARATNQDATMPDGLAQARIRLDP